jgi:cysteinyl-tRNA synthetase
MAATTEGSNSKMPLWNLPTTMCTSDEELAKAYPLMVFNSMTRTKTRFIPRDPNHVTWYQCGPTVYAESHLGHARTYVSLDVIRRITKDYLGYNVILAQNITDIDDKIIMRSSERGISWLELTAKYESEFTEDMLMLGVENPDIVTRVSEYVPEIIEFIGALVDKGIAYESNGSVYFSTEAFGKAGFTYGKLMPEQIGNSELLAEGEGALVANDDKRNGSDFALWKKTKDHSSDGIVEPGWDSPWGKGRPGWHIECSVMSNFALERLGGNKGLDIHCKYTARRCCLSCVYLVAEIRIVSYFALRVCLFVCAGGGTDLKFPHHENEIAQSEAYTGNHQWVNYFLHTGHLHIKGLKMAKSLKNFITIRQALEINTPRQIRFCFLLHKYNAPMDYGDGSLSQAVSIDKIFQEYFHNVKAVLRRYMGAKGVCGGPQHKGEKEDVLYRSLESTKAAVRAALMDDFDTPRAIGCLMELIKESNKYTEEPGSVFSVSTILVQACALYITKTLAMLGLVQDSHSGNIGFGSWGGSTIAAGSTEAGEAGEAGASKEQVLGPLLDVLTKFRETVRVAAINNDGDTAKTILTAADGLRDDVLPELGVRMEDKGSGKEVVTVWKMDDPEVLRKEKAAKEAAKAQKAEAKAEAARKLKEKEEKAKVHPKDLFTPLTHLWSKFGEDGLPTHDKEGEPISKAALKKCQKEYSKQMELYEKAMAKMSLSDAAAPASSSTEA